MKTKDWKSFKVLVPKVWNIFCDMVSIATGIYWVLLKYLLNEWMNLIGLHSDKGCERILFKKILGSRKSSLIKYNLLLMFRILAWPICKEIQNFQSYHYVFQELYIHMSVKYTLSYNASLSRQQGENIHSVPRAQGCFFFHVLRKLQAISSKSLSVKPLQQSSVSKSL